MGCCDLGRQSVGLGPFYEHAARPYFAGLGDRAALYAGVGGVFARKHAEPRHDLTGIAKAVEVADVGDPRDRRDFGEAKQCLDRFNYRIERPIRQQRQHLLREPTSAPLDCSIA